MSGSPKIVAGALAAGACGLAGQAFLAGSRPGAVSAPDAAAPVAALRGAGAALGAAPSPGSQRSAAAGAAAAAALAGLAAGSSRRGARPARVARNFAKEEQLGAQAPLGFWDPLGFCENEEKFKDFRAKELKHGRLAMMGALGMLVQSVAQVPGMDGVPKGVTACTVGNGQVGFLAILAIIGGLEAAVFVQDPKKEPGNFGNPLPWWDDYSEEMRARELNNGRIAMFSAIGIIAASLYTGNSAIEQFGL